MPWLPVPPVIKSSVRKLCLTPYHNHPKGCPNYGKKEGCPPAAKMIGDVLDLGRSIYVIYNIFPFGRHVRFMRKRHPEWTKYQLRCVLYWQGTARRQLKNEIGRFLQEFPKMTVVVTPEACGVNVTATMKKAGIELEWPPKRFAYQVALAGFPQ